MQMLDIIFTRKAVVRRDFFLRLLVNMLLEVGWGSLSFLCELLSAEATLLGGTVDGTAHSVAALASSRVMLDYAFS